MKLFILEKLLDLDIFGSIYWKHHFICRVIFILDEVKTRSSELKPQDLYRMIACQKLNISPFETNVYS